MFRCLDACDLRFKSARRAQLSEDLVNRDFASALSFPLARRETPALSRKELDYLLSLLASATARFTSASSACDSFIRLKLC